MPLQIHDHAPYALARRLICLAAVVAATAAVVVALPRQAAAQSTPTISVSCPPSIPTVAGDGHDIGTTSCTFTASVAPLSPLTVTYQVSGVGDRTLEHQHEITLSGGGGPTTGPVWYLRNTTESITVSIQPDGAYGLGSPHTATIAVGTWVTSTPRPPVGVNVDGAGALDGFVLLTSAFHNKFYLIDSQGRVAYEWNRNGALGKLRDDGKLLAAHTGTNLAEISPDGTDAYTYATPDQHHDVLKLANGDYMYIDSDYLTAAEATAAGADPACLPAGNDNGHVLELDSVVVLRPSGTSGGSEVWRWNVRDHLIQDFDSSKANYGVVGDHPERIDINYGLCRMNQSNNTFLKNPHHLTHLNSIDYNETLGQILITSRHFSEAWVIDYSTTTSQAAGSTGGTYGKGGDLLYRWGNPRTYRGGTKSDQELFFPHNAHWIPSGLPGAGNVLVYNNGFEHPGYLRNYASVDEVVFPAYEGNYLRAGSGFMPATPVWSYFMHERTWLMSNAQRLPNGNTLVVEGEHGRVTEVTPDGEVVWHYRSPLVRGTQVLRRGTEPSAPGDVWIYRAYKYAADHPGITALTLIAEADRRTIEQPDAVTPEVSVAAGSGVTEGGDAVFTVTADPAPSAPLSVTVSVSATGDFGVTPGSQTVTIPTTGTATVTVSTADDSAEEDDGDVTVTVASGQGYTVSSTSGSATVAVADDDPAPVTPEVSVTAGSDVDEGSDATFTLAASPAPASDLTVNISIGHNGDFGVTPGSRTVTIPTAGTATVTVSTTGDSIDEAHGDVTVTVTSGQGYTVSSTNGAATVTIEDDDPTPVTPEVSLAAGSDVDEGGDAVFTVTANPAPSAPLSVTVSVSATGDFGVTPGTHTVMIPTSGSATLTVATTGDSADEADGSVTATVDSGQGYTVSSTSGAATVTIEDDDEAPVVSKPSISAGDASADEGDGFVSFAVKMSGPAAGPVTVYYNVYGGTAAAYDDFLPEWGQVTFAPGDTSKTVQISLIDDSASGEGAETFWLRLLLQDTTHATMEDRIAQGTITDND